MGLKELSLDVCGLYLYGKNKVISLTGLVAFGFLVG